MKISVNVDGRKLETTLSKIQNRVRESHLRGMKEAAGTIKDYIQNVLLKGGMLRDTSDYLEDRSAKTNSLEPGELRKSVRSRVYQIDSDTVRITAFLQGSERLKEVSKWLQEGRTGPWNIPKVKGKWMRFVWHRGPNEGLESFALSVDNPGYEAKPFLHQALVDKAEYVKALVARYVRKGL